MVIHLTRRIFITALETAALLALILAAGYVSMGRILIANVDAFSEDIEARLSTALSIEVSLSNISGNWYYLDPEISIEGLVIGSPEAPAIRIERATGRLDTIASLRERVAIVREIELDGLALQLQQSEAGGWHVAGLPRSGNTINLDPVARSIPYLRVVNMTSVDVEVSGLRQNFHLTNQASIPFMLVAEGDDKMISMPLAFREGGKAVRSFELLGRFRGNPAEPASFSADLYMQLPPIELSNFLPPAQGEFAIEGFQVQGEFWLKAAGSQFELKALPLLNHLTIVHGASRVTLAKDLSARLIAGGNSLEEISVLVEEVEGEFFSQVVTVPSVDIGLDKNEETWFIAAMIPAMDVATVTDVMQEAAGAMGFAGALEALGNLKPSGGLSDIVLRANVGSASSFRLVARFQGLNVGSHNGSPALTSVDGLLSTSGGKGYIDLDARDLSIHFPRNFKEPWLLDSARARIRYEASPGHVVVSSDLVELTTGPLRASGRLYMSMPNERINRTWGLEIGIHDAPLLEASRYLPVTLDENLAAWLTRGIRGGEAGSAGLLFHGALDRVAPKDAKLYELYFKVKDTTLLYDPAWPTVDDLTASIYIGNWGVHSGDARGTLLGNRIERALVDVPQNGSLIDTVLIDALVSGEFSDGLAVLNETPVADAVNHVARGWQAQGRYQGSVRLDVPLGRRSGEPVDIDLDVEASGNDIFMPDYDLDIRNLSGHITYTNHAGLHAKALSAELFDRTVSARIVSTLVGNGGMTEVFVDGEVAVGDLHEWSGQSILARAAGEMPYEAVLRVPFGDRSKEFVYVEALSALAGITIDLPAPMKKSPGDEKRLFYRQTFMDDGFRIDLELGDLTRGSLKTVEGIIEGGRFHFGEQAMGVVAYDALNVSGELENVDYAEWERVMEFLDKRTDLSLESAMASALEAIDVHIASLTAFGLELDAVDTYIVREPGYWDVALDNELLSGHVRVPDDDMAPLDISLDYFRFASEPGEEESDPFGSSHPEEYMAADLSVEELSLDGEDYGNWSFRFRPMENGAVLESFGASVKGLAVSNLSKVSWFVEDGQHSSRFEGQVNVSDIGQTLEQWGFASSIEGEGFEFDADVSWPGSPAMVDIESMTGLVRLTEGQGRFVQAESSAGALKLLGIFDFASLARRFRFDFSDVVEEGFSFSDIKGMARLDSGLVSVVEPVVIEGSGSTFKVGGQVDLNTSELDNDMIVTLPVSRNLPWYAAYSAIATGPLAGVSVFLAQKVFENQINQMSSAKYKITGTVDEPVIEFVSIFSDTVRESPAEQQKPSTSTGE